MEVFGIILATATRMELELKRFRPGQGEEPKQQSIHSKKSTSKHQIQEQKTG